MIKKEFLEQSILATMLEENYLIMDSQLKPEMFYGQHHRQLFNLQIIQTNGDKEHSAVALGKIGRDLKQMAKEFNCPVICLSQHIRNVEARSNNSGSMLIPSTGKTTIFSSTSRNRTAKIACCVPIKSSCKTR